LKKREPGVSERPSVGPVAREPGRSRVAAAGDLLAAALVDIDTHDYEVVFDLISTTARATPSTGP